MEPAFFTIYCSHTLEENRQMNCPIRCGKGVIQYNPQLLENVSNERLEELLKVEAIRILLKHPYERQPEGCRPEAKTAGSDCVISQGYGLEQVELSTIQDWNLEKDQHYEEYARQIEKLLQQAEKKKSDENGKEGDQGDPSESSQDDDEQDAESQNNGGSGEETPDEEGQDENAQSSAGQGQEGASESGARKAMSKREQMGKQDQSALWEEDDLKAAEINDMIRQIEASKQWGSLPGDMIELVVASTKARIDYRKVLSGFRASILSSKRCLTRMKPSRRHGFKQMGSKRDFTTRLLLAVDVSGSVDSHMLSNFYGIINRFFKYGIEQIDVVQFDCGLQPVTSLKKASANIKITGRGGTDFQPVIDMVAKAQPAYDGLIILTDGYALPPQLPLHFKTKIVWVCPDRRCYDDGVEWMSQLGRVCMIELK